MTDDQIAELIAEANRWRASPGDRTKRWTTSLMHRLVYALQAQPGRECFECGAELVPICPACDHLEAPNPLPPRLRMDR